MSNWRMAWERSVRLSAAWRSTSPITGPASSRSSRALERTKSRERIHSRNASVATAVSPTALTSIRVSTPLVGITRS